MLKRIYRAVLLLVLSASFPVLAAEKITYHHFDALGSPIAATDEQGTVLWRETYQPYGERIQNASAAQANTRWYTGHPQDPETGLLYAGARYYDPVIGRFMEVDPKGISEGNIQSFNRYAYANNNPYKYIDPDGREAIGAILKLLKNGGERVIGFVYSKAEAVMARKQGETVVMETRQQARQVEEALNGGNKANIIRHKGHELPDGSTGHPHYQTEGKEGHSMWGKFGAGGTAVGLGMSQNDAEANTSTERGVTSADVVNFIIDFIVPAGVGEVGAGSDIAPRGDPRSSYSQDLFR